jgi:hypothetical protein
MGKTVEALGGKPADSALGAVCATVGMPEGAGLAVWACNPANDNPANTTNKTVSLINRTDSNTACTKQAVKLPHRENFHKRFLGNSYAGEMLWRWVIRAFQGFLIKEWD